MQVPKGRQDNLTVVRICQPGKTKVIREPKLISQPQTNIKGIF